MGFKLVVSNTVEVPVKFTVNDGGKTATFTFSLLANRLPADSFRALADDRGDRTVVEFLQEQITGWRGQRLVVDDNSQAVEFSAEALAVMLNLVGLAGLVFEAYVAACGAQGRSKN